ncbi:zinc finger protein 184 [Drosophila madeirensis]|uniref:Zinc finger protein 184 n=1 Tax=Drosophila madeirensis TaxID=30013 RepID=A0AAU9F757_DROMD
MEVIIKWSMCRTCKSEDTTELQPLFGSEAPKLLCKYAGINVILDDGLPDTICNTCLQMLDGVHTFVTTCQQADEQIKSLVRQTIPDFTRTGVENRVRARKQTILQRQDKNPEMEFAEDSIHTDETSLDEKLLEVAAPTVQPAPTAHDEKSGYLSKADSEECQTKNQANADLALCISVGSYEGYLVENEVALDNSAPEPRQPSTEYKIDLGVACVPERHRCIVCSNTYPNASKLADHLRTHLNEKAYECEVCSKRFTTSCNLSTHIRTHTGEKPYKCDHCTRCFADRSTHRKHERMHTNERPYACHICPKTFSLSSTRKAHILTHSKEKAHGCLKCNKKFRLPHQLKAHMKTHAHMTMEVES